MVAELQTVKWQAMDTPMGLWVSVIKSGLLLLGTLWLFINPLVAMAAAYTITLESSIKPMDISQMQSLDVNKLDLAVSTTIKDKITWYRLQAGHFDNLKAARENLAKLKQRYPGAWVTQVKDSAGSRQNLIKVAEKSTQSDSAAIIADKEISYPYVINLQVTYKPVDPVTLPPLTLPQGAVLYTTLAQRREQSWHYLRVGFFADREGASRWLSRLASNYPAAKVVKVTRHERENSAITVIAPAAIEGITVAQNTIAATAVVATKKPLEGARKAMLDGGYGRAIRIYRTLLDGKETADAERQQALELMALAYERMGKSGTAIKNYRDYLLRYPKGEASERVSQRLVSLESATAVSKEKLRETKQVVRDKSYLYGSLSVYYRHDADIQDSSGTTVNQSSLQSYLDITNRTRSSEHDLRARFSGGYRIDLLNSDISESNFSNFYVDYRNTPQEWSTRIGRQSGNSGGVLGRYDGIQLSKQLTATSKINVVMGNPLDSSSDALLQSQKKFYGISTDFGTFAKSWDLQAYAIQQDTGTFIDRRAVGGELRYFQADRNLYGLVDYDLNFQEINTILLIGGMTLANKGRINFMVDQRKSPTLILSNALQGQTVTSLSELALSYTSDEIELLARDRTAYSRSWMVGVSHPLNSRYQLSSDVTVSSISATHASGGVAATDASDNDFYINVRLNIKELLFKGDLTLLSLYYSNTRDMDTTTLGASTQFSYRGDWRINPRLYVDLRQNSTAAENYLVFRPSFRATNHQLKKHTFEIESGYDLTTQTNANDGYYINLGYRWRF
jgi:hypothetical protein